jgi:hypothetical protein
MEIKKEEILKAQELWAQGVVNIGKAYESKTDFEAEAKKHVETLYAYDESPVLFKPTKAKQKQFRGSKDTAVSYFVATNGACEEDKGFALQPWTKVRFENEEIVANGNTAMSMGNYYFTDKNGEETKVEYSFGYIKDKNGMVRINLHHSSLPFQG